MVKTGVDGIVGTADAYCVREAELMTLPAQRDQIVFQCTATDDDAFVVQDLPAIDLVGKRNFFYGRAGVGRHCCCRQSNDHKDEAGKYLFAFHGI